MMWEHRGPFFLQPLQSHTHKSTHPPLITLTFTPTAHIRLTLIHTHTQTHTHTNTHTHTHTHTHTCTVYTPNTHTTHIYAHTLIYTPHSPHGAHVKGTAIRMPPELEDPFQYVMFLKLHVHKRHTSNTTLHLKQVSKMPAQWNRDTKKGESVQV